MFDVICNNSHGTDLWTNTLYQHSSLSVNIFSSICNAHEHYYFFMLLNQGIDVSLREMNQAEIKCVSGANRLDYTSPDVEKIVIAGFDKLKDLAIALDTSSDWRYVVATAPSLQESFYTWIEYIGGSGQGTAASWAKKYA